MSTVNDKLRLIRQARDDIKTSLENKGQTVDTDIRTYASAIDNITSGIDTSDATATASDIISPKTAYINGGKITGSIIPQYSATKNILNIDCQGYINYTTSNDGLYLIYNLTSGINIIKLEDLSSTFISYADMGIPENSYDNLAVSARNEFNERYICVSAKPVNTPIYYALVNFNTFNVISNNSVSLGLSQGRYAWKSLGNSTVNNNILYVCGLCNNQNSFVSVVNLSKGKFTNRVKGEWFSNMMVGANDDYVLVNFTQDMFWLDEEGNIYNDNGTTFKNYLLNTEAKLALNTSNGNVYNYIVDYENKKLTLGNISFNINTKWDLPLSADRSESAFIKKNVVYLNGYGYYKDGQLLDVNTSDNYYDAILCKNMCKADIELAIPSKILTNHIDIYTSSEHSEIIGLTRGTKQYLDTSDALIVTSDVLENKVVYANNEKVIGTMPNNGELNYTPSIEEQTIPAGYTSGGTISAVNNQDKEITENGTYTADEGYTGLGTVTVNIPQEGGSGDIKLFATVEEMQADTTAKEGDLAVVYNSNKKVETGNIVNTVIFPQTVTLDTAITEEITGAILCLPDRPWDFTVTLTPTSYSIHREPVGSSASTIIRYSSEDGITYNRVTSLENDLYTFDLVDGWQTEWENIVLNEFMIYYPPVFEGFYEYNGNEYVIASTQLSTLTSKDIYTNKIIYTSNGIIKGDGSILIPDETFSDITAEVYASAKSVYDNMTPIVITSSSQVDKNIKVIPLNKEGDILLDFSQCINMSRMFERCTNLTEIPLLDTSSVTDMSYVFHGCKNLTEIPLLDTSKVTNMYCTFQGCSKITEIPQLDTSNVTNMFTAFYGCTNLTTIPQLDTSKVTNMTNMFMNCTNLTTIPLLDTSSVTRVDYMFKNCNQLTTIPLLDTSKVTNMHSIFYGCTNLTTIPLLDTSKVTTMTNMFKNCTNLIEIPQLNTSSATKMNGMFERCTNLTEIPLLDTSRVTNIQNMLLDCNSLSDESLNNILSMCKNATSYTSTKTLAYIGLSEEQATKCITLSNYQAFTDAGWTTGY